MALKLMFGFANNNVFTESYDLELLDCIFPNPYLHDEPTFNKLSQTVVDPTSSTVPKKNYFLDDWSNPSRYGVGRVSVNIYIKMRALILCCVVSCHNIVNRDLTGLRTLDRIGSGPLSLRNGTDNSHINFISRVFFPIANRSVTFCTFDSSDNLL